MHINVVVFQLEETVEQLEQRVLEGEDAHHNATFHMQQIRKDNVTLVCVCHVWYVHTHAVCVRVFVATGCFCLSGCYFLCLFKNRWLLLMLIMSLFIVYTLTNVCK